VRALFAILALLALAGTASAADAEEPTLDQKVRRFLEKNRGEWRDMNVPWVDGQILHDLVVRNRHKRALEIGTSTGHSGIWTAWALSKTGGRLVTIEIDEGRYREALRNFEEAGLSAYIDARRADAHELVPRLEGPFDFVFIDADKDWYTSYARAVIPKLRVGGCLTAHNVSPSGRRSMTGDFYQYITSLPFLETSVTPGGVSISYKRREQ